MKAIHADGFQFGRNPSEIGGGFTIVRANGELLEREVILKAGFTNNEAELLAVARAVELSLHDGRVITDSKLVLRWLRKGRSKARPDLNPTIGRCKDMLLAKRVKVNWVPRDQNLAGRYNDDNRPEL